MNNIISVNQLEKSYGKNHIGVRDINLNIVENEIFGLIGPNGAGKSTTIRTIVNLLHPTSGNITVFNKDSKLQYKDILRDIGYLPGELHYYDNMKIIELLKLSEKMYKTDCSAFRDELASLLNLDLNQKISNLSLGNKKKVGIIDAMQHRPKLLILDEPTSGLDPLIQQKFLKLLETVNKEGTTIIFSSHALGEVQKICDRAGIIKDGSLIKIEDLKENNKFKKIIIVGAANINIDLPNISNVEKNNNIISFLYRGDAHTLINYISGIDYIDVTISEPDLEEVFMHYYE